MYAVSLCILLWLVPWRLERMERRNVANQALFAKIQTEGGVFSPTFLELILGIGLLFGIFYFTGFSRYL